MADFRSGVISTALQLDICLQVFAALRASLAASGWSEYDIISDTSTNKNIVFRGAELNSGAGNRPYVRLFTTGIGLGFATYSYWNNSTHNGIGLTGGSEDSFVGGNRVTYWIRSNPVSVTWCTYQPNTGYYFKRYAGLLRRNLPAHKSGVTKTTGTNFYGDTVINVATDMTGKLQVGQRVMFLDNAANGFYGETQVIQAISPTTITLEAGLGFPHTVGSLIGYNPIPTVSLKTGSFPSTEVFSGNASYSMDGYYWGATQLQAYQENIYFGTETYTDPADFSLAHSSGVINVIVTAAVDTRSYRAGSPYHWELMSAELLRFGDTVSDGTNNYVLLGCSSSGLGAMVMGPI